MSKIVSAINAMISNSDLISNIVEGWDSSELFFMYDGIHKWSVTKSYQGELSIHYYSTDEKVEYLANMPQDERAKLTKTVSYSSETLGTREARESLEELYTVLQEKLFGMDKVFDQIISTDS